MRTIETFDKTVIEIILEDTITGTQESVDFYGSTKDANFQTFLMDKARELKLGEKLTIIPATKNMETKEEVKQTAIDCFLNELENKFGKNLIASIPNEMIEKVKDIEKEQILDAFIQGNKFIVNPYEETEDNVEPELLAGVDYYYRNYGQSPAENKSIPKDTLVYVRDRRDAEWEIRFYSHCDNGIHYCFYDQKTSKQTDSVSRWRYVKTESPFAKKTK